MGEFSLKTAIWAHRGASGYAPENTMAAFALALQMGADGLELDVHLTRDGVVVVAHDETLERVSNGTGRFVDYTFAQLRALNFGNSEKLPTLEEVYAMIKPTKLQINVEIKSGIVLYEGIEKKILGIAKAAGMNERVIYSSFNHYSLMTLRQICPSAKIGLLYQCALVDPWLYAQHIHADALHPFYPTLASPGLVEGCKKANVALHPWTVNAPEHIKSVLALGVEAVITNYPDVAIALRDAQP